MAQRRPHLETDRERQAAYDGVRASITAKLINVEPLRKPIPIIGAPKLEQPPVGIVPQPPVESVSLLVVERMALLRFVDGRTGRVKWHRVESGDYAVERFGADIDKETAGESIAYRSAGDGPVTRTDFRTIDPQIEAEVLEDVDDPMDRAVLQISLALYPYDVAKRDEAAGIEGQPIMAEEARQLAADIGRAAVIEGNSDTLGRL